MSSSNSRQGQHQHDGGPRHVSPLSKDGVEVSEGNSVFALLHSWFLPAAPVNTIRAPHKKYPRHSGRHWGLALAPSKPTTCSIMVQPA